MRSSGGYMSKEIRAYIKSGAIYKSVKRVRELMKCEFCFNECVPDPAYINYLEHTVPKLYKIPINFM